MTVSEGNTVIKRLTILLLTLATLAFASVASAQALRVTGTRVNLRNRPSTVDGTSVGTLSMGDELEVIDQAGGSGWYHVRVKASGAEGYVNRTFVQVVLGVSPAPAQPAPGPSPAAPPAGGQTPAAPAVAPRPPDTTVAPPLVQSAPPLTGQTQSSSRGTPASPVDRPYFVRLLGGIFSDGREPAIGLGGGVAGRPFGNDQAEVEGDFTYLRFSGGNAWEGSGNFIYNFHLSDQRFTPFGGAGLVVYGVPSSRTSETTLQILGGIEKPISDKSAFRAELRLQFFSGFRVIAVLGGVSF